MIANPFPVRLVAGAAAGCVVRFILSSAWYELSPPQLVAAPAALDPEATSGGYQFASDAGMMLKFIKADRTADFEATVEKLQEALARSGNPERRQQAQSWRVFKAAQPATNGDVVYVFEFNPPVRGADYTVSRILKEAFPAEARSLIRRYAESSSARQHVVDLELIASFGEAARNAP
jgi:hypothetical protein